MVDWEQAHWEAARQAVENLGETVTDIQQLRGATSKKVFEVTTPSQSYVVRADWGCAEMFEREALTMKMAEDGGVRVPAVHARSNVQGLDTLVMDKIDGTPGTEFQDKAWLARELGKITARVNTVPFPGFGCYLDTSGDQPRGAQTWSEDISGNLHEIFVDDALIDGGALTATEFDDAWNFLRPLCGMEGQGHLTHCDVNFDHVVVTPENDVVLNKWTWAQPSMAPQRDVGGFIVGTPQYAAEFAEGYGLSKDQFEAIRPDCQRVGLTMVLLAAASAQRNDEPAKDVYLANARRIYGEVMASQTPAAAPTAKPGLDRGPA